MKVRYKYRIYPTAKQREILAQTFGCCRFVYNWALRLRTDSYQEGKTINYYSTSAELTKLKRQDETAWLNTVSSIPTQQALRHLQTAFRNFFDKRAKYPTFKRKHRKQAAEYTKSAFKWDAANHQLTVAKLGKLKIRWSREFKSSPTTTTITKDRADRYFVTFVLDEQIEKLPKTGKSVGIDLGISRLATLSDGERIPNPKHLWKSKQKLAKAQRILSRRQKGSKRWQRQRLVVARIHAKIADSRIDYLNKVTTDLVRRFDVLCVEDLHVRGMMRNHCLARSLSDAALGTFTRMVDYKCTWYGKTLKQVDRWFPSSKRCNVCGHILSILPLSVREWDCPECGSHHDRDENAAINILAAGHAVTARGGCGRPKRAEARGRGVRGTENQSVKCVLHTSAAIPAR